MSSPTQPQQQQSEPESYTNLVDLTSLRNYICDSCTYQLDSPNRQLRCKVCGHTKIFKINDLVEKEGKVYYKGKELLVEE